MKVLAWICLGMIWIIGNFHETLCLQCYDCSKDPKIDCGRINSDLSKWKHIAVTCNEALLISGQDRNGGGQGSGDGKTTSAPLLGSTFPPRKRRSTELGASGAPSGNLTAPPAGGSTVPPNGGPSAPLAQGVPLISSDSSLPEGRLVNQNDTGGMAGTMFPAEWEQPTNGGKKVGDTKWVCVKQEVFTAAKLPPGVKGKSDWNSAGAADTRFPSFVNRYCTLVRENFVVYKKQARVIEQFGGKFAMSVAYCDSDLCNNGIRLGGVFVTIWLIMATTFLI